MQIWVSALKFSSKMFNKAKLVSFNNAAASVNTMQDYVFGPPQPEISDPLAKYVKKCNKNSMLTTETIQNEQSRDGLLERMKIMLWVMNPRQFPVFTLQ
jgi:hypothetical protein